MDKVVVNSYEDFEKLLGRQIGISDYVEVSQDRINLFDKEVIKTKITKEYKGIMFCFYSKKINLEWRI